MNTDLLQRLQDKFFRDCSHFATADVGSGIVSYAPVEGKPTEEELSEHLQGLLALGAYTLHQDNTVSWLCWDVDCTDLEKARNIALDFHDKLGSIPHAIEFSGNKGYHIWLLLASPIQASKAREFGLKLRELVGAPAYGNPHVEVFPKQDKLDEKQPLGNLVKLPLGAHPKTLRRSIFVDPDQGWEDGPELDPISIFDRQVDVELLDMLLLESDPITRITGLLIPHWTDGERHNLVLCLAGYLGGLGWAEEDTTTLVKNLLEHGGEEKNLLEAVEDTYQKIVAGQRVIGFKGLAEKLPVPALKSLAEAAGANVADPIIQVLDRIRLEKGVPFLKIRQSVEVIVNYLAEMGRFVRTPEDQLYWLEWETHQLYQLDTQAWVRLCYNLFGLNMAEQFSKQVKEGMQNRIYEIADPVKVHRGSYWDGQYLWINFGGAEVLRLSGDCADRQVSYNGENGKLFITDENGLAADLNMNQVLQASALDPWSYLVNDLNFAPNELTAATDAQQKELLKAWLLSMFFRQLMPTRPILSMIGPPGSGKTTAARRILRFVEGFQEDVLALNDDKPDSLRSSVARHSLLSLDNLEKVKASWLLDFLNRLSTGNQIELRKLYKTNENERIRPDCYCITTAVEMPFSDESIFSRLLPMNLCSLAQPRPEVWLQSQLKDNLAGIWAGMLNFLDCAVLSLHRNRTINAPTSTRLADFASFCSRMKDCNAIDHTLLLTGLDSLVDQQRAILRESSAFVQVLEIWLSEASTELVEAWHTSSELNTLMSGVARKHNVTWRWTNGSGLGMHIAALEGHLRRLFNLEVREARSAREGRGFRFIRTINLTRQ